eukprot:6658465-Alexandrium_andersonii.AAC.1
MVEVDEALTALVEANKDLELQVADRGTKARRKSAGHEMPLRLQVVTEYINGSRHNKYNKAREKWRIVGSSSSDPSEYAPH